MKLMTATILLLALAAPAFAQNCDTQTIALIDRALPAAVGNIDVMRTLLAPPVSSDQLSDRFNPATVGSFVRDELASDCCSPFLPGNPDYKCTYINTTGSGLRVDLSGGRVIYTNRDRSQNKQPTTLTEQAAFETARRAAVAFGIPEAELADPDFRYLKLTNASMDPRNPNARSFRAEGHVRYQRAIGGVPVAFSKFHVALDSRGDIARTHVRWPDFALAPGLNVSQTFSRSQVLGNIVDEIVPTVRCGTIASVVATIVYAKTSLLEEGEATDERESDEYAPALLVTLVPVEQPEDSGVPQMPAENFVFPLLGTPDV
ncbi:MAG TPA: hypothetical protein VN181_08355 [Thermoanaerobaculia bacterium]|nr:hypothetical protein [Thermoanaerobaculia bacterium]